MKKILICILLVGLILVALRSRGTTTGIRVVDASIGAVDESLREYVLILESYIDRDEGGGPSVTDMLGAAMETSPNSSASESEQEDAAAGTR